MLNAVASIATTISIDSGTVISAYLICPPPPSDKKVEENRGIEVFQYAE